MILSQDFRKLAKESLRGRWGMAVAAGFVAGLLGASTAITTTFRFNQSSGSADHTDIDYAAIEATAEELVNSELFQKLFPILVGVLGVALVWILINLIIGGAVTLGYAQFNLNLVDDREPRFLDIFSHMRRLWEGFCMQFFQGMLVLLWSLLFVIPGVIASYRYSMTPYILAENMDLSVMEAIAESKRLMRGNKWRLFCLEISFLCWDLLGAVTFGLLSLWVKPYKEAAKAVFYREISEQRYSRPAWNEEPLETAEQEF